MKIEICVGSSCHVRGSYGVVKQVENYVKELGVENQAELKGCFCMGHCTEGVSILVDQKLFQVSEHNVREVLKENLEVHHYAAD